MLEVKKQYDKILELEIRSWCRGVAEFEGEIDSAIVFKVVTEIAPTYQKAIECNVIFNIIDIANKFSKAAKFLVKEKEIAFVILSNLPSPTKLDENGQFILAQVIDQVEQKYGGALARLQKKWSWEKANATNCRIDSAA